MGSADPADLTDPIRLQRGVPSSRPGDPGPRSAAGHTPPGPWGPGALGSWGARESLQSLVRDGFLVAGAGVLSVLPQNPSRDTRRRMETKLAKRRMLAAAQGTRDEWAMSETGGGDEKCRTWAGPGTLCPTPTDGAGFQNKPEKQEMLTTPGQQPFPKEPASQRRSVAPRALHCRKRTTPLAANLPIKVRHAGQFRCPDPAGSEED